MPFWSDYVYANGKRIVRADNNEGRLHATGTFCSNCGWQSVNASIKINGALALQGYLVKQGDKLLLRQYQTPGSRGGVAIGYTDGPWSGSLNQVDSDGQPMWDDATVNEWHYRRFDLSRVTGKTISSIVFDANGDTAAGTWNIYYQDLILASLDGTVQKLFAHDDPSISLNITSSSGATSTRYTVESAYAAGILDSDPTFYHGDHLGSSRMLTNLSGYPIWQGTYYPYGAEYNPQPAANSYKFTGKERDAESGLDYFGARYYASSTGRFLSADDFTKDSHVTDPQSWNKYAYARNNPLRYSDPTGEEATITTHCIDGGKSCQVDVNASIAIYAVNGTTADQLKQAQAALTSQIDEAWSGSFTQDGVTYNVSTNVTVSIVGSENDAFSSGAQNAVGIDASGKAQNHMDSGPRGQDRGIWDFSSITSGQLSPHEFSHIVGLDDNHGNVLSNAFSRASMGDHPHATGEDFQWAFGPELSEHKTKFNVGQREGRSFFGINRGNRHWWEGWERQSDAN